MRFIELKKSAALEIGKSGDAKTVELLRVKYLGRKSELTKNLRSLKDLPLEQRRKIGPEAQRLKKELEELFEKKLGELNVKGQMSNAGLDITKPGKKIKLGHLHPLSKIEEEIHRVFLSLNFSAVEGPEIETEYYNFDALNIPADHPARDMWDTFWLRSGQKASSYPLYGNASAIGHRLLMRTHTSPMQIRYMEKHEPPFQIIVPGRVFRFEATDASHEINFHQVEGLMIGKDVSLANFKFVIEEFFKRFFGPRIEFRFRPSYFPFVEPGLEVDIKLATSDKRQAKWLEVMGAGMVHRKVLEAVKYDHRQWQGFAFGLGLERLAMIKYQIPDIRLFYSGDLRFIRQF